MALVLGATVVTSLHAQDVPERKLVTRVPPKYPEDLRRHDIGGTVRLMVIVTPTGNVKTVTPIGGNPILVEAASNAVKQWKYASSENTDTFEVKVDFVPRQP